MDAYNVAFPHSQSAPRSVCRRRDERRVRPDIHHKAHDLGQGVGVAAGQRVINALDRRHRRARVLLGIVFAEPLVLALTDDKYTASRHSSRSPCSSRGIMLPTLTLIALAAALMGMLNSLHHFFIPALSPAMFNVVTISARSRRAVDAGLGHRADRGDRDRHAAGRRRPAGAAVADAAPRRIPVSADCSTGATKACSEC